MWSSGSPRQLGALLFPLVCIMSPSLNQSQGDKLPWLEILGLCTFCGAGRPTQNDSLTRFQIDQMRLFMECCMKWHSNHLRNIGFYFYGGLRVFLAKKIKRWWKEEGLLGAAVVWVGAATSPLPVRRVRALPSAAGCGVGDGGALALGQAWLPIGLLTCQSPGFSGPQQTHL